MARKNLQRVSTSHTGTYNVDDVLSLSNSTFSDYLDFIYLSKLEIKDTTESIKSIVFSK